MRCAVGDALNAYKMCRQVVVEPQQCSTGLLTTRGAPLQCQVTRQLGAMLRMGATWQDDKTRRAPAIEDIICYPSQ
jgi:hypothetical protein